MWAYGPLLPGAAQLQSGTSVTLTPTVGAITIAGVAPTVSANASCSPTVGAITITGLAPTFSTAVNFTGSPTVGAVTISGVAPTVAANFTASPTVGAVTISGVAPTFAGNFTASPTVGTIAVAGVAPTVSASSTVTPITGRVWFSGDKPIQLVGYTTGTKAGSTSGTTTLSLTALTGGIGTAAQAGDLVVAFYSVSIAAASGDQTFSITDGTTEYSLITEVYAPGSYSANLRVAYKLMGGTPDTATTFGPTTSGNSAGAMAVYVFRGVNASTPVDVAAVVATGTTGTADPGGVTPATSGAFVVMAASFGSIVTGNMGQGGDLTSFTSTLGNDLIDTTLGVGISGPTSSAFNPAALTDSQTHSTWGSVTFALRPEASTPSLAASSTMSPTVGGITYTGLAPTVTVATNFNGAPTTGAITITGLAPAFSAPQTLSPTTGSITITGVAPSFAGNLSLTPTTGAIIIAGVAPTTSANFTASPTTGAITITGLAPTFSSAQIRTPTTGAITIVGSAPTITRSASAVPTTGAITVTGLAPTVSTNLTINSQTGQITITGYAPTVTVPVSVTLNAQTGQIAYAGTVPSLILANRNGFMRVWTGTEWIERPVKVWNGSTWEVKPLKVWDGSDWILA